MAKKAGVATRLIAPLLGAVVLALLGWRVLRSDSPPVRERAATPRSRSSLVMAKAPVSERPGLAGAGTTLPPHELSMPVSGVDPRTLRDSFSETRGGSRSHDALDILAPRGTPVLAADDGAVRKLFTSVPGGLTVYEFDREERYCYYYAHLDGYAPGLHEGQRLRKGDLVGYVGTTGNAPKDTPHLHFAITRLEPDRKWWTGTPVNPYPLLAGAR